MKRNRNAHHEFKLIAFLLQDKVIGILDWELSTLGNQMCDVAYSSLVFSSFFLYMPVEFKFAKHSFCLYSFFFTFVVLVLFIYDWAS